MNSPLPPPGAPLEHYVSDAPYDPNDVEADNSHAGPVANASQKRLMWWYFRQHRVAVFSGVIIIAMYLAILICEFLAPYNLHTRDTEFIYAPPASVHFFRDGELVRPYTYGQKMTLDMTNLRRTYSDIPGDVQPLRFFCRGDSYKFWNIFDSNVHLICPAEGGQLFLFGTDRLGRDVLSRTIYGARVSLTIGILGVTMSFILGIVIGGIAGYRGGLFDMIVQRITEVLQSIPSIPLWMALATIIPLTWSPLLVYVGITVILGLLDWTGLARAVRSKLLSLREEDYVVAAQLLGAGGGRVIRKHMVPGFMSHLIASATLTVPGMILGETALSFLGIGLRPPITSWGILLTEAQSISIIALYPWLLLPVLPVIIVILAFNFLGDGLRDSADPYK
ncbi:MAG: peptide/nickel transport system permease protein [Granulosicoccus sp.]|jgi:peptide/nickel transport system permease protein